MEHKKLKCPACGMTAIPNSGFCRICGEWIYAADEEAVLESQISANAKGVSRTYEYEYDSDGKLEREYFYSGDHSEWTGFTYDDSGRRIRLATYENEADTPYEWAEYEYDRDGNRVTEVWYDESGAASRVGYKYDSEGRRTQQIWYDEAGGIEEWVEYEYDKNGNATSEIHYYAGDEVDSQIETIYADDGRPLKEVCYRGDFSLSWQSEYNENGQRLRVLRFDSEGKPDGRTEYEYDEKGHQVCSIGYDSDGCRTFRIEYRYGRK